MAQAIAGNFYVFTGSGTDELTPFEAACAAVCEAAGFGRALDPFWSAFAIAPGLRRKLGPREFRAPNHGTLIFHPSVLPHGRGPDAIRWAMERRQPVSGVTWFWADEGLDTGPICTQAPVVIDYRISPRENYERIFQPAALEALVRAVKAIRAGGIVRLPQAAELATYDTWFPRRRKDAG